jgi:hypothetical protein
MKYLKFILVIASVGVLFTLSNCGGSGSTPEPVTDQQLVKLTKTWKLTSVTLKDAGNVTTDMSFAYNTTGAKQFTLVVTGTKGASSFAYTTSGNPASGSVWKGSSDWSFGTDPLTMIKRDNIAPVNMTYVVSGTNLELKFNFTGAGYPSQGRVESTTGEWIFTFGI